MATSHDPKLTCQGGPCTEDHYLAAEAASEQPRIFECTAANSHLTSSEDYVGPSHAEVWGRTFKMSHDHGWRDPWLCTGRDNEGRWLWRLVSPFFLRKLHATVSVLESSQDHEWSE